MTELPSGWTMANMEQVFARLQDGRTLHQGWSPRCEKVPSESDDTWGVLKTTAIQPGVFLPQHNKALPTRLEPRPLIEIHPGDILVTCAGPRARCGVSCLVGETRPRLMMSGKMYRFRVPTEHVDARFIAFYLQTTRAWADIDRIKTGGSDSGLNLTHARFRELQIPVAPITEQRKIVAAIEEQFSRLDAGVAGLERVQQNLKRMRAVVLRSAVTGRLVPQHPADGDARCLLEAATDARHTAITKSGRKVGAPLGFSTDGLPQLPESWHWASLDALAEVVGGATKDSKRETGSDLVEVPYLRVANVQRGYLDLNRVATIRASPKDIERLRLVSGDVLFNEGGDRDKLGRGWVWEGQIDPCIHQNHVFRARLYHPVIDPRLLSWHGNTFGQEWFSKGGKQTTNLASVSKTTLRSFPVPVPPLAEQGRIVKAVESELSVLDAIENIVRINKGRSGHLRSAILSSAFSGELVPQDSNAESASRLLERIATEHASSDEQKPSSAVVNTA
jgi:type I restriction enzyme S subunit